MALAPKRQKHRKVHRGKIKGNATRGNRLTLGNYGLQALEPGWINSRQIESGRIVATQMLRGIAKIFIRIFPHKPVTTTPQETRMGKGKGEPEFYVAVIRPGTVLYEVAGDVPRNLVKQAMKRIAHKMPLKVKFIDRRPL